jgi:hypothetical protein
MLSFEGEEEISFFRGGELNRKELQIVSIFISSKN